MCKNVEKKLEETAEMPVSCTVEMDGKTHTSDDFVCVMTRENGDASLFYNTDALTLGMAMKMVARAFVETSSQLTEEERTEVTEVLGAAFVADKPEEEAYA